MASAAGRDRDADRAPEQINKLADLVAEAIAAAGGGRARRRKDGRGDHLVARSSWGQDAPGSGAQPSRYRDPWDSSSGCVQGRGDSVFGPGFTHEGRAYLAIMPFGKFVRMAQGRRSA